MTILHTFILGIVQALTEFLPVSSSAHLIILPSLFKWDIQPLSFDVVLHLGTAAALLTVFWHDLFSILQSLIKDARSSKFKLASYSKTSQLGFYVLLACIPAIIAGLLFGDLIEESFRKVEFTIIFLLLGTILMSVAEIYYKHRLGDKEVSGRSSIIIGLVQVLALLPGVSRSGSTISAGMLTGLSRINAARFSFLMSVPLVLSAGVYELLGNMSLISTISLEVFLVGFSTSFIFGVLVIKFLLNFLNKHSLMVFIAYRLLLVLALIMLVL